MPVHFRFCRSPLPSLGEGHGRLAGFVFATIFSSCLRWNLSGLDSFELAWFLHHVQEVLAA
jgi:hypothetical protein